jgi:transporter family protein
MNKAYLGIFVGGLIPALFFGLGGFMQKLSARGGISLIPYTLFLGAGVLIGGLLFYPLQPQTSFSIKSAVIAVLIGISWALGMGLVKYGISAFGVPLSKLVPLYNMNTLIAVALGLIILAEWKQVNSLQLVAGAILIVIGGTMVANS